MDIDIDDNGSEGRMQEEFPCSLPKRNRRLSRGTLGSMRKEGNEKCCLCLQVQHEQDQEYTT